MKFTRVLLVTTVLVFLAGMTTWQVSAQNDFGGKKGAPARDPRDPLTEWMYPPAKVWGEVNGERLPTLPLHAIQTRTADSIDSVYSFYRRKADPNFGRIKTDGWDPGRQLTMLMTQFAPGATATSFMDESRKDADSALIVIRYPKRTITIQISRDPQDKSTTDILLLADEH